MRLRYAISVLFLLGASLALSRSAESVSYAEIQQSVKAKTHTQTIHDARAFLRQLPQRPERAQVMFWLAEALYATQAYQDAVPVYADLLEQAPYFPQASMALYHLGLSDLQAERYNAALDAFAQLLEQYPGFERRHDVVFHMATIYFKQGRFESARPLYEQLQNASLPSVSVATLQLQLGHTYFCLQEFTAAQQQYNLIIDRFPNSPEAPLAHYQLGAVALAQQAYEIARQHFQTMLQLYEPGAVTVRAHYGMAWTLYYEGQIGQAVAYLQQRNLLAQPSAIDAVFSRSYDLVQLGEYDKVIPLLTQTLRHVQQDDQKAPLHWLLAQAYEGSGDMTQTLRVLDAFIGDYPHHPLVAEVQAWRGRILHRRHDISLPLNAYQAALATVREEEVAERLLMTIADLYRSQDDLDDAIMTWQRFLDTYPLSPRRIEVQLQLGIALVRQGAVAQAVSLYRRLLATPLPLPAQTRAELQLAWAYLKGGEADAALGLYGELVQRRSEPDIVRQARFWRGWILQHQEQYEAANAEWTALLPLEPAGSRRGEVLWRLGRNAMELGQYAEGRDYLLEVLTTYALEPYAFMATWQLQRCLLELKQDQEALQQVPVFVQEEPLAYFKVTDRFTRGKQLFDAKQYQEARRIFRRIVSQPFASPLADDAAFMIAESYFIEGDRRRALGYYREVTQRYRWTNVTALASYREGLILKEAESLSAAAQALLRAAQQATEADIRDRAWYDLGNVYMQLQQRDKAVVAFRRLLQVGSVAFGSEAERLHLGLVLQQLADYDTALHVFRQIVRHAADPRIRAEAQFWMAETHQLGGETAAALAAYRQVAEQFPEQREWALTAWFRVGEIYETMHQYQDAIRMYQRVVTANPDDRQGQFAAERVKYLKSKHPAP